ncbi:hypothetical protein [Fulvivirga imtechensis]|nr:hypothetical protein [Fulvivirga imtechensis]
MFRILASASIFVCSIGLGFSSANQYLHLVTDSHFYVSGDVVKIGIICRETGTGKFSDEKLLIRLHLVNSAGDVVLEKRMIINDLNKSGEFVLPSDLVSGNYTVYAHDENGKVNSGRVNIEVYGDDYENTMSSGELDIDFSTETGIGVLLLGEENHVEVYMKDSRGNGVSIVGKVYDDANSVVADVSTDENGYARFKFVAQKRHYTMRFVHKEDLKEVKLPLATSNAAIIGISENGGRYIVEIYGSKNSNQSKGKATLTEFLNDSLVSELELDINEKIKIMSTLPSHVVGKLMYILKDSTGQILARREIGEPLENSYFDIYLDKIKKRRQLVQASLHVDSEKIDRNSLVLVKIFDKELSTIPRPGKPLSTKQNRKPELVLKPPVDDPTSKISVYHLEQRYAKEFYLERAQILADWLREMEGDGTIWSVQFDKDDRVLGDVEVKLNYKTSYSYDRNDMLLSNKYDRMVSLARKRLLIRKVYLSDNKHALEADLLAGTPDYSIQLSQYQTLPTVEETLKAIVPKCRVVRHKGQKELRIVPKESSHRYERKPFILINGIPTFDGRFLLDLNVNDIQTIDLFNSAVTEARYGTFGKNGVISVDLKPEAMNPLEPLWEEFTKIEGMNRQGIVLPSSVVNNEAPDLRCTLYWSTNLRVNDTGRVDFEFYSSDVEGNYVIYVEIIAIDGRTYTLRKEFSVEYR